MPVHYKAVLAVVDGVSPLIVVLPTGAGKSLTFIIPALFPGAGTTVVITPLVALAEDLLKHCKKFRIDCILYGQALSRMAKIIIIVMESAISKSFNQILSIGYLSKRKIG